MGRVKAGDSSTAEKREPVGSEKEIAGADKPEAAKGTGFFVRFPPRRVLSVAPP